MTPLEEVTALARLLGLTPVLAVGPFRIAVDARLPPDRIELRDPATWRLLARIEGVGP